MSDNDKHVVDVVFTIREDGDFCWAVVRVISGPKCLERTTGCIARTVLDRDPDTFKAWEKLMSDYARKGIKAIAAELRGTVGPEIRPEDLN